MSRRLEATRIGLGFASNDPIDRKKLKDVREMENRRRERLRRHDYPSLARPKDIKEWINFQFERTMEHALNGRATSVEIDYLAKHS